MHLCHPGLLLSLAGEHSHAVKLSVGQDCRVPKESTVCPTAWLQETAALPTATANVPETTQGTKPTLPRAWRDGCGATRAGQRAHAVRSLPALLRLWLSAGSSTFPGLSQHKTHLGRILFPPRVITGPAKSHLLFAVTGLTALLLLQFDRSRGLITRFDGRWGDFPPICRQRKEVSGAITQDRYPLPKPKTTVPLLQVRGHPPEKP